MNTAKNKKRHSLRWLVCLLGIGIAACALAGTVVLPRKAERRMSLYIPMRDGVKLAVDVWLPVNLKSGQKLPTVMRSTAYWRSYQFGPLRKMMEALGLIPDQFNEAKSWIAAGYALVTVDARGTGASYGQWHTLWSEEEIADLGQVVDWIAAQPWSNGRVGAFGVSYDGNTAERMAGLNHPALKAIAPQFDDFDIQAHLTNPGGVYNQGFIREWDVFHHRLGANDVCGIAMAAKMDCDKMKYMLTGVRPVDEDADGSQLAAAVAQHTSSDLFSIGEKIEYRGDTWGETGLTYGDMSPYTHRETIEASGTPMYVWVSWLDSAVLEGALSRYQTFKNPQKLIIGPWSHGGAYHADPFLPADTPVDPSLEQQFELLVAFFDAYLKDPAGVEQNFGITYYTLGEGAWKQTETWPPAGFKPQRWYFAPNGALSPKMPAAQDGEDFYTVDWTATTGATNRWYTGLFKDPVVYPDRAVEDRKLLSYTSAPLAVDVEITGSPVVSLFVASSEADGAFHVYLEDVAADGRVTYITEGILRAVQRKISTAAPPYMQPGPYHSNERADAMPLVPGEVAEIRFNLYATSVLVRQGHSLRIAIAGHDASTFARYPADATPQWQVQRNRVYASYIDLPVLERP